MACRPGERIQEGHAPAVAHSGRLRAFESADRYRKDAALEGSPIIPLSRSGAVYAQMGIAWGSVVGKIYVNAPRTCSHSVEDRITFGTVLAACLEHKARELGLVQ